MLERIVVVGPGAIGCLVAALLARKNLAEIWLLDHNARRAKKLNEGGIQVAGLSGEFSIRVPATAQARDIPPADLGIVCVKAYDTREALTALKPVVSPEGTVLSLQNGLGNLELLSEEFGPERTLAGVTAQAATLRDAGLVIHTGNGETVIGRPDGTMNVAMRTIRELFTAAGIPVRLSKNITATIWSKLVLNVGLNAVSALSRLPNGAVSEEEAGRQVMAAALAEAVKVAKKVKVKLLYDDPLQKIDSLCRGTSGNISSMLQDVLAGKKTEIEQLNGAIVRLARNYNVPTPVNTALTNMIRLVEGTYGQRVP